MNEMNHTKEEVREIAETIAQQFGGAAAFFMIGAKRRVYGEDGVGDAYLQFNIMRNATSANACRITYNEGTDLYDMEFLRVPRSPSFKYIINHTPEEIVAKSSPKSVKKIDEIFCDNLREIFEDATGLTLTMPRVVGFNA